MADDSSKKARKPDFGSFISAEARGLTAEGMVLQQSPPVDLLNSGGAKASIRVLAGQCTAGMGRRLTLLRQAFLRTTGSNPTRCIPAASPTPAAPTTRSLTAKVDPNTSRAGGKTSASAAGSPVS